MNGRRLMQLFVTLLSCVVVYAGWAFGYALFKEDTHSILSLVLPVAGMLIAVWCTYGIWTYKSPVADRKAINAQSCRALAEAKRQQEFDSFYFHGALIDELHREELYEIFLSLYDPGVAVTDATRYQMIRKLTDTPVPPKVFYVMTTFDTGHGYRWPDGSHTAGPYAVVV